MDSRVGLIIQFAGIFLVTVLTLFLHRSLRTSASKYWTIGWASLSCALFGLVSALSYPQYAKPLSGLYFFGEYVFGLLLLIGCHALADDFSLKNGTKLLFLPLGVLGFTLPLVSDDFNLIFKFHTFVLASFFTFAFYALKEVPLKSFGWRVMRVALAILAIDFYHYSILYSLLTLDFEAPFVQSYVAFIPIFDLVLEILLGFGMVIVSLEKVLQEAQTVHGKLAEANQKLEQLAHIDPLTTAFNRHAFYGYLKKRGEDGKVVSGCVGFFDIDDLKLINDQYGHAAGDAAIHATARAIRELIRAEDIIYRWGGDEFFVIMVSMNAELARKRMHDLDMLLNEIRIDGVRDPLTIRVSYGFTDFADTSELEVAVKSADQEMYGRKQSRKKDNPSAPPGNYMAEGKTANSVRP
jgi:diguanylate cyclase (GGDEF)-like protein